MTQCYSAKSYSQTYYYSWQQFLNGGKGYCTVQPIINTAQTYAQQIAALKSTCSSLPNNNTWIPYIGVRFQPGVANNQNKCSSGYCNGFPNLNAQQCQTQTKCSGGMCTGCQSAASSILTSTASGTTSSNFAPGIATPQVNLNPRYLIIIHRFATTQIKQDVPLMLPHIAPYGLR